MVNLTMLVLIFAIACVFGSSTWFAGYAYARKSSGSPHVWIRHTIQLENGSLWVNAAPERKIS